MGVTLQDVAERAGVSRTLVSHVVRNPEDARYRPETRARVIEAARALNYRTNRLAAGLIRGRTGLVSLVMPWNTPEIVDAAEAWAEQVDCRLIVQFTGKENAAQEQRALHVSLDWKVDGLLWMPYEPADAYASELAQMRDSSLPIVTLQQDFSSVLKADAVMLEFSGAMDMLVQTMLASGYRRAAFVMPPTRFPLQTARWTVFEAAARAQGLPVIKVPVPGGEASPVEIGPLVRAGPGPLALFCNDDWIALRVLQLAREAGWRVPEDLGVASAGDLRVGTFRLGEISFPPLTVIRFPLAELIGHAVELLQARMAKPGREPRCIRVPGVLYRRASLGGAAPTDALKRG